MSRSERYAVAILILLLLLGLLFWGISSGRKSNLVPGMTGVLPSTSTAVAPSSAPAISPAPSTATPKAVKPKHAASASPLAGTTHTGAPVPPELELHKELIPKNIEIIRCYYAQEVAPPGTTFGFDINGSGFTSEFEKMITVESGHPNIRIKNLHLITTNQIHGDLEIGPEAKTGFVFPRVLIKKLPVFSAPEPFAVVRKGEVLTVFFVSMEESGRGGKFRVITNLDEASAKTFQIIPSTRGIQISELVPQLPYLMEGHLQIGPGVPPGEHGLTILINGKEVFRRMGMIRIVRPNIGQSGFVQGLTSEEKYHRPGDVIQIYVQGTGLSSEDSSTLEAKVLDFDFGKSSFTYLSPLQLRLSFNSPAGAPVRPYGVRVLGRDGQTLFEKKDVFSLVAANWVAGVQVSPPVKAGGSSTLKVMGRDFSDSFAGNFHIDVDEPGIVVTGLRRNDPSTLIADISVSSGVAPGDYWLHLSAQGQKVTPPFGSIIKVEAAH